MGKIAFVFSGQGDQYVGMGRELCESSSTAAEIFDICESIRGGTKEQCFFGSEEALRETKNTQPCLFAMEMAAAEALKNKGILPDAVAGFSLGEVVAATFSGVFDIKEGFRLVIKRGALMQTAAESFDTAMAAVVKLTAEKVEELCEKYENIYPVNYNCPGQITVAGLSSDMPSFTLAVKEAGGRAIPLKVSGAFHSPFMNEAAVAFARELGGAEINDRKITIYSNVTGEPYGENTAYLLSSQICNPVRWELTVRNMISAGIDTFIEIGPGKTLVNMIKKIDASVNAYTYTEYLEEV